MQFDDVLLSDPVVPDFSQHRNYGDTKENIKNFRENDYFFKDLLNKEWHPQDVHMQGLHDNIERKRNEDILRKSLSPSNSVFVFDPQNNEQQRDRNELDALLRSFVDQG